MQFAELSETWKDNNYSLNLSSYDKNSDIYNFSYLYRGKNHSLDKLISILINEKLNLVNNQNNIIGMSPLKIMVIFFVIVATILLLVILICKLIK